MTAPFIAGGQGRTAREVERDGVVLSILVLVALAALAFLFALSEPASYQSPPPFDPDGLLSPTRGK